MEREQKPTVIVNYDKFSMITGVLWFLLGIISKSIVLDHNNDSFDELEQSCPGLKGRVFNFCSNTATWIIILGLIDLSKSGVISRGFLVLRRWKIGVFFGLLFMGLIGTILKWSVIYVLTAYNIYGSKLLWLNKNILSTDKTLSTLNTYCHQVVLYLSFTLNVIVYAGVIAMIALAVIENFRTVRAKGREPVRKINFRSGLGMQRRGQPRQENGRLMQSFGVSGEYDAYDSDHDSSLSELSFELKSDESFFDSEENDDLEYDIEEPDDDFSEDQSESEGSNDSDSDSD